MTNLLVCCLWAHSSLYDDGHSDDAALLRKAYAFFAYALPTFLPLSPLTQMTLTSKSRIRKKHGTENCLREFACLSFYPSLSVFAPFLFLTVRFVPSITEKSELKNDWNAHQRTLALLIAVLGWFWLWSSNNNNNSSSCCCRLKTTTRPKKEFLFSCQFLKKPLPFSSYPD